VDLRVERISLLEMTFNGMGGIYVHNIQ
jgi:hypothetical protein